MKYKTDYIGKILTHMQLRNGEGRRNVEKRLSNLPERDLRTIETIANDYAEDLHGDPTEARQVANRLIAYLQARAKDKGPMDPINIETECFAPQPPAVYERRPSVEA